MPEENTAENKIPVPPDQSFPDLEEGELSLEEGELSEEDLEAAAGGSSGTGFRSDVERHNRSANMTSPSIKKLSGSAEELWQSLGGP